jgi:hypothetical protein
MIDQFEKLASAGELVQLEKAALGREPTLRGDIGAVGRGVYGTIGSGTAAVAKHLKGYGLAGRAAGLGVRAAPWLIGGALINKALGNPVGNTMRDRVAEFKAKQMQHQGVYDPSHGRFY